MIYLPAKLAEAEKHAVENFKNHVLEKVDGHWLFHVPGSSFFYFRVFSAPGMLLMAGDTGELIFCPHGSREGLAWLRGVLDHDTYSVNYVAEKVSQDVKVAEFQQGLVDRYVEGLREELVAKEALPLEEFSRPDFHKLGHAGCDISCSVNRLREAIVDLTEAGPFYSTAEFYDALDSTRLEVDERPEVEGLTFHFFHCVAGLRAFCRALDAQEKADAERGYRLEGLLAVAAEREKAGCV